MRYHVRNALSLILALLLALSAGLAWAEKPEAEETLLELIPLEPGMNGDEVENLNARLTLLGYLSGELSTEYGEATEEAVRAFQAAAGLEVTGTADVVTQQALMGRSAPANPDNPIEGELVWIPKSGERYHTNWNCGNMKGPSCVTVEEAEAQGYTPCGKCFPQE